MGVTESREPDGPPMSVPWFLPWWRYHFRLLHDLFDVPADYTPSGFCVHNPSLFGHPWRSPPSMPLRASPWRGSVLSNHSSRRVSDASCISRISAPGGSGSSAPFLCGSNLTSLLSEKNPCRPISHVRPPSGLHPPSDP